MFDADILAKGKMFKLMDAKGTQFCIQMMDFSSKLLYFCILNDESWTVSGSFLSDQYKLAVKDDKDDEKKELLKKGQSQLNNLIPQCDTTI